MGARPPLSRERAWVEGFFREPLFDAVRKAAEALPRSTGFPPVASVDAALFAPLRAVGTKLALEVQGKASRGPKALASLYDVRITDAGVVPTRELSWHDLMNALVFASFPRTKRVLHARHADELRRHYAENGRLPNARSRLQDVLALFDEGGVVLVGPAAANAEAREATRTDDVTTVAELLRQRRVRAYVFGHAILEHRVLGEPLPRAMPLFVDDDAETVDLDGALAGLVTGLDPETRHVAVRLDPLFETPRAASTAARDARDG